MPCLSGICGSSSCWPCPWRPFYARVSRSGNLCRRLSPQLLSCLGTYLQVCSIRTHSQDFALDQNCVDIHEVFRPFRGQYKGENFDSGFPPRKTFPNAISCKPFSKFISDTIIARLASGAISLWGKVGHVDPPYLVLPLTVEETKHTSTILLGSSPLITFVLFLYLARCTSMIATRGKSSYPSRLQLMPLSPRSGRNPLLGHCPQFFYTLIRILSWP